MKDTLSKSSVQILRRILLTILHNVVALVESQEHVLKMDGLKCLRCSCVCARVAGTSRGCELCESPEPKALLNVARFLLCNFFFTALQPLQFS